MSSGNSSIDKSGELFDRVFEAAGVVNDEFRNSPFVVQRNLTRFPTFKFASRPASILLNPLETRFKGCINKDDGVTQVVPACFQHDRSVKNDNFPIARDFGQLLFNLPPDFRMYDFLQLDQ